MPRKVSDYMPARNELRKWLPLQAPELEGICSKKIAIAQNIKDILDKEYKTPLTPDLFAERFGYPPAMVRLAIECGLKSPEGKITGLSFCQWFTAHYNDLRGRAGLPLLDIPTDAMTAKDREHVTIGNVIRTHADYLASRTSSLEYKEEWMNLSNEMASCSKRRA